MRDYPPKMYEYLLKVKKNPAKSCSKAPYIPGPARTFEIEKFPYLPALERGLTVHTLCECGINHPDITLKGELALVILMSLRIQTISLTGET